MARRQARVSDPDEVSQEARAPRQVDPQKVIYDANVPEILVDGITAATVINGVLRLSLASVQQIAPNEQQPRVVLRLAISLSSFLSFQQAVNQLMAEFQGNAIHKPE